MAIHNKYGLRKWSTHLLKVRQVTNGGAGLKLIQPKNQVQLCLFGSRGNWTSTKPDVLEAWLYPATFDFLPAVFNLGSLRQFTLKV